MGSLLRVSGDKREDDLDGIAMGDIHAEQKSQYFNNPLQVRVPRRNGGGGSGGEERKRSHSNILPTITHDSTQTTERSHEAAHLATAAPLLYAKTGEGPSLSAVTVPRI